MGPDFKRYKNEGLYFEIKVGSGKAARRKILVLRRYKRKTPVVEKIDTFGRHYNVCCDVSPIEDKYMPEWDHVVTFYLWLKHYQTTGMTKKKYEETFPTPDESWYR